jgi:colanic acid/amylovoran biosynthesis protein
MKILVENSAYSLLNMGDAAMLQVAISRLEKLFPDATIKIFTDNPKLLPKYLQNVLPISTDGRNIWCKNLVDKLAVISNENLRNIWITLEKKLRFDFPFFFNLLMRLKLVRFPKKLVSVNEFIREMEDADLIFFSGGGYVTDAFWSETFPKLYMIEKCAKLGKPVVLLGQGIGPFKEPENFNITKSALAYANFLALREKKGGLPLLKEMNIQDERIMITGDDAIELAYELKPPELGSAIGINLRMASYSNISADHLDVLKLCIQNFALDKKAQLAPVPIDHTHVKGYIEPDSLCIKKLLEGFDDLSDGGASLDTPLKIIQEVGKCRVVLTGSYHAGVFALSQGIPVIALAKSQYYINKFSGLSDQFPGGCKIILLDDKSVYETLKTYLTEFWETAEILRPQLLSRAQEQILLGHEAYSRVYQLTQTQEPRR